MSNDFMASLRTPVLRSRLKDLGAEVGTSLKRVDLLRVASENGINDETFKRQYPDLVAEYEPAPEPAQAEVVEQPPVETEVVEAAPVAPEQVLLKMERANPKFEVRGYVFTRASRILLVNEDDAQFIMDTYDGFRIASPREAKEFYS